MKPRIRITVQVLLLTALTALSIYLMPQKYTLFKYQFEVGQPWSYGAITAEYDFAIYKTDAQLKLDRDQALRDYTPCYTVDANAPHRNMYILSLQEMKRVEQLGCLKIAIVNDKVVMPIDLSEVYTPQTAFEVTHQNMLPNLSYDSITSEKLRESLISDVSLVHGMVQKGERIISPGEIVTEEKYQILESLRRIVENKELSKSQSIMFTIGIGIFVIMVFFIFVLYFYNYRRKLLDDLRNTFFFVILMAMIIASSFFLLQHVKFDYIYMLPFAWGPIITRIFYDSRTAIFMHVTIVLVVSLAVPNPYMFILLQLLTGVIAVISLRDMTQRAQLAQTALYILLTYSVIYTATTLFMTGDWHNLEYQYYICFAINAVLVICAYGLIFLFERSFGLVSSITLVELTNVNSDLMLSFSEKAPGTFHHSLQVSNLATEAAKRIGAKVLLVRTGALYHDIGKMMHPEYFTENQSSGQNPLLNMSCQEAAKTIIDHVKDGERIARKHHLPEMIIHFICSHHGTSLVRYFYNTAVNEAKAKGLAISDVKQADFSYPGPKPTSKESAILMMADAIEARSRSLEDLTVQNISEMVDDMINQQIAAGQFSETPLSFKDLEDIRMVFKQKLLEMNHQRITYPAIEKDK